jgi:dCMP deaminase
MGRQNMSDKWDNHFLRLCVEHASMSKDPSTKVGAVIVGPDREIRSTGFNGFPRGVADTTERLNDRDIKLSLVVHGEMNAILNAARIGVSVKDCTLYLAATDDSGVVWGGVPCTRCAVEIIQSGIKEIVSKPFKSVPSRWGESIKTARLLLEEAGITYREITS